MDAREVERLLAIELGALAPAGPMDVALACADGRLRMTARDPVLDRRLVREVAIGAPEPGRDRTIALLVSQLFLTSWAEEFLEHPGPRAPAAGAGPRITRAAPAPAPAAPPWELQLAAGTRLRDWSAPALGETIAATASRRAGRLRLLATAGFERGSAGRDVGTAVWTIGQIGGGLAWRTAPGRRLGFGAALIASTAWASVRGDSSSVTVTGGRVSGALGDVALSAGPSVSGTRWRLALNLEIGATFPSAIAQIAGDRDLRLSGGWAGASLSVGWAP